MVLLQTIFVALLTTAYYATAAPTDCLSRAAIEHVAECLETYAIPKCADRTTRCSTLGNPNSTVRGEWVAAVKNLMNTSTSNTCTSNVLGSSLQPDFAFALYTEPASLKTFCLLYEKATSPSQRTRFKHGWGFIIVPADSGNVLRSLHFSAPHPKFDEKTVQQAAALFKLTGGKSMAASGRHRHACIKATGCVKADDLNEPYSQTDAAHDDTEPIFSAMDAIREWQNGRTGGCPTARCGYLQFHGNSNNRCPGVFLSHGSGPVPVSCHNSSTPVRRLKAALDTQRPGGSHRYPGDPRSTCPLYGTKNIFGRLLNEVHSRNICTSGAQTCTGQFVHIEQDAAARDRSQDAAWAAAIAAAYPQSGAQTPGLRVQGAFMAF